MRIRKQHPWWFVSLVALLFVSNLPRLGCISSDGTHLPYCQNAVRGIFAQVADLFRTGSKPGACCCCCGGDTASTVPQRGCNGSSEPCECQLTLEGPEWTTSARAELSQSLSWLPWYAPIPEFRAVLPLQGLVVRLPAADFLPDLATMAPVRLNV